MNKSSRARLKLLLGILSFCLILYAASFIGNKAHAGRKTAFMKEWAAHYSGRVSTAGTPRTDEFGLRLSEAAFKRTKAHVRYNGSYFRIPYPGGDVPADVGVCSDVLIRSYRELGIDLQKNVHEDMKNNFDIYPKLWGLRGTDTNIDHRRVPNLMVFFSRKGIVLPITDDPKDYRPGDIVAWNYYGLTHIGIVSNRLTRDGSRYMIVHNIGRGPQLEDFLFSSEMLGHFRYEG